MKTAIVICSYKSAKLTTRVCNLLRGNRGADVFVLENSPTKEDSYSGSNVIHMGYENVGYGGMHDYIFREPRFRDYDFVGIFNNDVFDIPHDFMEKLRPYFHKGIGMLSPVFSDKGTSWPQMRRLRESGYREVDHVEDMAAFLNTDLFPELVKYTPMQFFGILDVQLSQLYKHHGYKNIVVDDVQIGHMLAGARKAAGTFHDYTVRSTEEMQKWHERFPLIRRLYEDHMAKIGKKVTVIISSYGYNHLIRRAAESALDQEDTDVVVVDDGSVIQPLHELEGLPVRYFSHDKNRGLGSTRNTAIANTISPWILPLDSDDYLNPGVIKKMLDNSHDTDIVYGNLVYQHDGSRLVPTKNVEREAFLTNNQIFGASLYRRELWDKTKYLEDPRETYEDWAYWGMCAMRGARFRYVDVDVYNYNGDAQGMCARVSKDREHHTKLITDAIRNA